MDKKTLIDGNGISPNFRKRIQFVRDNFFSRNADLWPVFRDPNMAKLIESRKFCGTPEERIKDWENGPELLKELQVESFVPNESTSPTKGVDSLLLFAASLSKNWEDPSSVENVISMASDPAIYGSMMGVLANPNLVHCEYSDLAEEVETNVVRQIANLVGYNPERATGIFTQGGTFCNMYGYLFGIRKSIPNSIHVGLGQDNDYRIINSQGGHYSNTTNLSVLGVNLDKKTIRIQLTDQNDMDMEDLEEQLSACFQLGCIVPTIMLTMGTTDTFGVDRVKPVYDLCEKLCEQYEVDIKPHIHVDSAVGWPIIFFLDYDFEKNPLDINAATLSGLARNVERFKELKYADSFTVDFHKWGFVPYTSSLVMVKDKSSMEALEHDPENFSYFEKDTQGQTHLQSTIECSRGATGVFGAYSALKYMGVEGYQTAIAHGLQNANYFRSLLAKLPNVKILAAENRGPSVGFRLYDPAIVKDADAEFAYECDIQDTDEYRARVARNSEFHRNNFKQRGKEHLYTNWVQAICHTDYDEKDKWSTLPGEKAVMMNVTTRRAQVEEFVKKLAASFG